ncbi:MAG: acetylxylan esterase [Verrucomicrobiales bacterium]|nr:acetylxylan esterase [Verrucomicrobiales bacterium]
MKFTHLAGLLFALSFSASQAEDSLSPYEESNVPRNVLDLWKDVDTRKDPLETEVVKEWTEDGVVCRYVIFKVGTFKGKDSRIAAFYTFPEGQKDLPAVVWSHGGGQRAELVHGKYFAKNGYAMVDINWGGREIVPGIEKNTDWGAIDPSQGPRFYPGALREHTKLDFRPDEHTIDPVVSPRNGNWFMLAYAGRRAITFLENQPEVDPKRLGFTGFSMGGNITSFVAIDPRLKAVVPMVGGASRTTTDFPGLPGTGRRFYDHTELFTNTMESLAYYPHVNCPVLLLSASDDFHSTFENIYTCMEALPHDDWRVSQNMHLSHGLGPDQWIMMNLWFDKFLKEKPIEIPKTADPEFAVSAEDGTAVFAVTPDQKPGNVSAVDIYYSHDPNPKSRFWITAKSVEEDGTWTATLPVLQNLPLFAFANCSYPLESPMEAFEGTASHFSITSDEAVYLPESIDTESLHSEAIPVSVFSDIKADGFRDWGFSSRGGMTTYKFRDPRAAVPAPQAKLKVTLNPLRKGLSFRFRIGKNKYITGVHEKPADYSFTRDIPEISTNKTLLISASDFKDREKSQMEDWSNISTFTIAIYDGSTKTTLDFRDPANRDLVSKLEWVDQ